MYLLPYDGSPNGPTHVHQVRGRDGRFVRYGLCWRGSGRTARRWLEGRPDFASPAADHQRILVKASFLRAQRSAPILMLGDVAVQGRASDSEGLHFSFDSAWAGKLRPATEYSLRLHEASLGGAVAGDALCDAWPLRTFPAPDSLPDHVRLLTYTCAGGSDRLFNFGFFNAFLPIAHRRRLLARALSFAPDVVVANGDHVYWDMKSRFGWAMGEGPRGWWLAGRFDRDVPIIGTPNELVLKRAFGPQIADLYGVMFRSLPGYFLQDDHDYGENDEASEALRTFPADPFMLELARTTQSLYYPELLGGEGLPSVYTDSRGVSESFGTLRYGRLFEGLLYDCRRHLTNSRDPRVASDRSGFVPPDIESWLMKRSAASPCAHLAHMPSTPVLWTAGKWAEWYPDFQDERGVLRSDIDKPFWPQGWGKQHDRLLAAVSDRRDRLPLFVSGDLHATAVGRIHRSQERDFSDNPILSVLTGALGTGELGFPSQFRGQLPSVSGTLEAEEWISPLEENGFSLIDLTKESVRISFFKWLPRDGEQAIDSLEPFRIIERPRSQGSGSFAGS